MAGLDLAEQDIAVGDGERAAAAIGGGAGVGAGAFGADEEARAVPAADRASPCGNGVDAQHRGADARAGDDRLIIALERSEEHTSELQSLMRKSYAVFCLTKKKKLTTVDSQLN